MISMLTKVLPGDIPLVKTVQWPTVRSAFASNNESYPLFGQKAQQEEATELQNEIAELKAELRRTRSETDRRVEEAFTAGKRDGELSIRQAFEQQWDAEMAKLKQIMQEAAATGPQLRRQAEEELVRLAVAVARRILHRELTIDADALTGLIKAALERLDQREIQQIRTDGGSAAIVQKIAGKLGTAKPVKVIADGSLRRGSLVIETQRGQLDASLETQLQEIERGFIDIVRQS